MQKRKLGNLEVSAIGLGCIAMSQPDEVDINEILFRPTSQEL